MVLLCSFHKGEIMSKELSELLVQIEKLREEILEQSKNVGWEWLKEKVRELDKQKEKVLAKIRTLEATGT